MPTPNKLYQHHEANVMLPDVRDNSRPEPLHNLNITRIRNRSNLTCGGRLLRAYPDCLPDVMLRGMTSIAFSPRLNSGLKRERQADTPSLPSTTTSGSRHPMYSATTSD